MCAGISLKPAHVLIHSSNSIRRGKMRRITFIAIVGLVFLFGSAAPLSAQVKRVQMHIAGYLCGN
jgi:hypothetical protein